MGAYTLWNGVSKSVTRKGEKEEKCESKIGSKTFRENEQRRSVVAGGNAETYTVKNKARMEVRGGKAVRVGKNKQAL